jgi:hypothetical protein
MTHPKTRLVDIINLNADASCLSTKRWMNALNGGKSSELYRLLESYVIQKCKINLGIIGSTLAEIQKFNPECISLINNTPEIFEILIRPFIHSLSFGQTRLSKLITWLGNNSLIRLLTIP